MIDRARDALSQRKSSRQIVVVGQKEKGSSWKVVGKNGSVMLTGA
jgi:hypothetical protein